MAKRKKKKQPQTSPACAPTSRRTLPILAALGVTAVLGAFYFFGVSGPQPEVTWSNQSPGSASADAGHIDAAACAGCHAEVAKSYSQTGMGRSFYRALSGKVSADFTTNNTCELNRSMQHSR